MGIKKAGYIPAFFQYALGYISTANAKNKTKPIHKPPPAYSVHAGQPCHM